MPIFGDLERTFMGKEARGNKKESMISSAGLEIEREMDPRPIDKRYHERFSLQQAA